MAKREPFNERLLEFIKSTFKQSQIFTVKDLQEVYPDARPSSLSSALQTLEKKGALERVGSMPNAHGGNSFAALRIAKSTPVKRDYIAEMHEREARRNSASINMCRVLQKINPSIKMIPL